MMGLFQKSGLNFIANPTENAYLQGRQDTYPKRRGLTRVKEMWESGINVCFGQDSINDPWYPVGNGNMMNILDNGIHLAHTMSFDELDRCLDLITYNGAKTLNVEDQYGIEDGQAGQLPGAGRRYAVRGRAPARRRAGIDPQWRIPVQASRAELRDRARPLQEHPSSATRRALMGRGRGIGLTITGSGTRRRRPPSAPGARGGTGTHGDASSRWGSIGPPSTVQVPKVPASIRLSASRTWARTFEPSSAWVKRRLAFSLATLASPLSPTVFWLCSRPTAV